MMKIRDGLRGVFLIILASCLTFVALETCARCYLWVVSGMDSHALVYGWTDRHLKMDGLASARFEETDKTLDQRQGVVANDWAPDGSSLEGTPETAFESGCGGAVHFNLYGHQILAKEMLRSETLQRLLADPRYADGPITAWAFGGSTTAGRNYSADASSWPEELEKLAPDRLRIVNHGENGFSSDQSIDKIKRLLKSEPAPQVVFWANWVNESDVLYFVMDRNYEALARKFPELGSPELRQKLWSRNAHRYLLRSLVVSLDKRLVVFRLLREALSGVTPTAPSEQNISTLADVFLDRGVAVTVENYRINLDELLELSRQYGFQVVIVRLPIRWRGMLWENGQLSERWLWAGPFNKAVDALAKERNLPALDLQRQMLDAGYFSTPNK
jgi:hypothetical protein